jgi:phosphohistidine swiveling domain-containing protein
MIRAMRVPSLGALLVLCLSGAVAGPARAASLPDTATLRTWVEEMKASPQGPFERIRWYCKDGTVLPPKAYACRDHGGGVQHGEWTERVQAMRDGGWNIATVYADISPAPFVGPDADLDQLDQMLLERFLVQYDDGWILRGARSYRGALQVEDEEAGAKALVLAMLADPEWLTPARFARLREAVRLLPLPRGDEATAYRVRAMALQLAEKDRAFTPIRAKIHNAPDARDAARVREYASKRAPAGMKKEYQSLASQIDELYSTAGAAVSLGAAADHIADPVVAGRLREATGRVKGATSPAALMSALCSTLAMLRDAVPQVQTPEDRLLLLETSLALEDDVYTAGTEVLEGLDQATRRERLGWLGESAQALYGVGFISRRHLDGVADSIRRVESNTALDVDEYRSELRYLARAPEWSSRWLEFNFGETVQAWSAIEPLAVLFPQDRLRGSPLLFYSSVVDSLSLDANHLAGIQHDLFGQAVGSGLRALNPGLTHGGLVAGDAEVPEGGFSRDGIYLLPESTADLPRVSGILTRGEGSSLSHVQLLARNLGIPNVVVGEELVPTVQAHNGQQVVLAVSPKGVVQLVDYAPRWDAIFGREDVGENMVIRPDLEKLDLTPSLIPLTQLRASDSGRLAGPKGANLGELKHHFGDRVPDGFVITFGVFRQVLEEPIRPGGPSAWEWMKKQYDRLETLHGEQKQREVALFLEQLRDWIMNVDPGPGLRQGVRMALNRMGPDGTFGVFVRSDTNVEDLPGFTGAGLNLTVPNVVGYENVMKAIKEVWASPFTERAYGWRQNNMEDPEYVLPSVVVQKSFPSEKSGVLVTVDVDTGKAGWLTVAVNEGVGGAVEGQAAESLKIDTTTGETRFLAQATAPRRARLSPTGGVEKVPASGTDAVLKPSEIQQLVAFSRIVSQQFPSLRDENGNYLPADVEFGFKDGRLHLLQIRPFNESRAAQKSAYLSQLDAAFAERGLARVNLDGVPQESS